MIKKKQEGKFNTGVVCLFVTYKNGELTQKLAAVLDPYAYSFNAMCYTVDTQSNLWSIECETGDVIDIRFHCVDEYGLGYDFLLGTWVAEGETKDNEQSAGASIGSELSPVLYWPE